MAVDGRTEKAPSTTTPSATCSTASASSRARRRSSPASRPSRCPAPAAHRRQQPEGADGRGRRQDQDADQHRATVGAALKEAGVELDANDEVEPAVGALLSDGDEVTVTRIKLANKTEVVDVAQPVEYKDDKTMEKGTTKVLDPGQEGRAREHVLVTEADGKERSRLVLESVAAGRAGDQDRRARHAAAPAEPARRLGQDRAVRVRRQLDINTGNGYYGGLQFSAATWKSVGGPGLPHEHSREVQIKYAKILQARSGWGQWGCAHAARLKWACWVRPMSGGSPRTSACARPSNAGRTSSSTPTRCDASCGRQASVPMTSSSRSARASAR